MKIFSHPAYSLKSLKKRHLTLEVFIELIRYPAQKRQSVVVQYWSWLDKIIKHRILSILFIFFSIIFSSIKLSYCKFTTLLKLPEITKKLYWFAFLICNSNNRQNLTDNLSTWTIQQLAVCSWHWIFLKDFVRCFLVAAVVVVVSIRAVM